MTFNPTPEQIEARKAALAEWQAGNDLRQYSEFFTSFEDGYNAALVAAAPVQADEAKLAEVERRAAEEALTDAAEAIDPDSDVWIPDPNQPRGGLYWTARGWLHDRAKTYRRNEGENDG